MPSFRFVQKDSTIEPHSGYAPRIAKGTWSRYESMIRQLHAAGTTSEGILNNLEVNHGFTPSSGQLRDRMKVWGLRSYRMPSQESITPHTNMLVTSQALNKERSRNFVTTEMKLSHTECGDLHEILAEICSRHDMDVFDTSFADEIYIMAEILFSARRYSVAYKLYQFLYHAAATSKVMSLAVRAQVRVQSIMGSLRSAANDTLADAAHAQLAADYAPAKINKMRWQRPHYDPEFNSINDLHATFSREELLQGSDMSIRWRELIFEGVGGPLKELLRWCTNALSAEDFRFWSWLELRNLVEKTKLCETSDEHHWNCCCTKEDLAIRLKFKVICQQKLYWHLMKAATKTPCSFPLISLRMSCSASVAYKLTLCETLTLIGHIMLPDYDDSTYEPGDWLNVSVLQKRMMILLEENDLLRQSLAQVFYDLIIPTYNTRHNFTIEHDLSAYEEGMLLAQLVDKDSLQKIANWSKLAGNLQNAQDIEQPSKNKSMETALGTPIGNVIRARLMMWPPGPHVTHSQFRSSIGIPSDSLLHENSAVLDSSSQSAAFSQISHTTPQYSSSSFEVSPNLESSIRPPPDVEIDTSIPHDPLIDNDDSMYSLHLTMSTTSLDYTEPEIENDPSFDDPMILVQDESDPIYSELPQPHQSSPISYAHLISFSALGSPLVASKDSSYRSFLSVAMRNKAPPNPDTTNQQDLTSNKFDSMAVDSPNHPGPCFTSFLDMSTDDNDTNALYDMTVDVW